MTEFAHRYASIDEAAANGTYDTSAKYLLVCHRADGSIETVDSNEMPALTDKDTAIDKAMFAIKHVDDTCDLLWYGECIGTAEYVDLNPGSFLSSPQAVFSEFMD